jgi:membrane protein
VWWEAARQPSVHASPVSSTLERVRIRRIRKIVRTAFDAYGRHNDAEFAAALAYRALFSLVPFVALLAAVLDAVLPTGAREDVVDWLLGALPGTEVQASVEREVARSGALTSVAGLVALGALIWSASGMTSSLRVSLGVIWESERRPDFVRAKLRDFLAVGVLATLVLTGFGLSLLTQIAIQAGISATDAIGLTEAGGIVSVGFELLVSGAATFAALLIVYGLAAPERLPFSALWPSALAAAVIIDAGVAGYAFYLVRIASFSAIYGPLGAVLAFLALLYVAALLVLVGAELVVATDRSRPQRVMRRPEERDTNEAMVDGREQGDVR